MQSIAFRMKQSSLRNFLGIGFSTVLTVLCRRDFTLVGNHCFFPSPNIFFSATMAEESPPLGLDRWEAQIVGNHSAKVPF
jgi:hypothetical protein